MAKPSSFRLLITLLLAIQALCWTLTLLNLLDPARLRLVLRATTDLLAPVLARPSAVLLSYRQFCDLIPGLLVVG